MNYFKPLLFLVSFLFCQITFANGAESLLNEIVELSSKNVERWQKGSDGEEIFLDDRPKLNPLPASQNKKGLARSKTNLVESELDRSLHQFEPDKSVNTYYFASLSLPRGVLTNLLESLGKEEVVVFRGPLPNENLVDLYRKIGNLLGSTGDSKKDEEIAAKISLEIDPTKFKECGIIAVPATCVILQGSSPLSVHGTYSGEYLKKIGRSIDHAVGQTWKIAEIDLEEEIKKRILSLTPEDFREESIKSVFLNREYVKLPVAKNDRAFKFDPSIVLTEPIEIAGRRLASVNQKFNPASAGLDYSYIIFDATDPSQISTVVRIIKRLETDRKRVSLMITDLPNKKNGFSVIERLTKYFGRRVTIIDTVLADKFRLSAVPSVVESVDGGLLLVNEVKP